MHSREDATLRLDAPATSLAGIAGKRAGALAKLGIATLRDLLAHYPRRYLDLTHITDIRSAPINGICTIIAQIHDVILKRPRPRLSVVELHLTDGTGLMIVTFFNQHWLADKYKSGMSVSVSGKVEFSYGYKRMVHPIVEDMANIDKSGSIVALYPACANMPTDAIRRAVGFALKSVEGCFDPLPLGIRARRGLVSRDCALKCIHAPKTMSEAAAARRRLAYEELLYLQLYLQGQNTPSAGILSSHVEGGEGDTAAGGAEAYGGSGAAAGGMDAAEAYGGSGGGMNADGAAGDADGAAGDAGAAVLAGSETRVERGLGLAGESVAGGTATHAQSGALRVHACEHVVDGPHVRALQDALPFTLSLEQIKARDEILHEMSRPRIMNHMLMGDVGCGKTVCAAFGLAAAKDTGTQAFLLAPTEVLARQHLKTLQPLLAGVGINCALLCGSTPSNEREQILRELAGGQLDVLIGTHALLEPDVLPARLTFAVIDEQQRFGVDQRARLLAKGAATDALSLSATPIPRSLAIAVMGNYTMSAIHSPARAHAPRTTRVLRKADRGEAYGQALAELEAGHQVYVVCPLIGTAPKDIEGEGGAKTNRTKPERRAGSPESGATHPASGAVNPASGDVYFARSANYTSPSGDADHASPSRRAGYTTRARGAKRQPSPSQKFKAAVPEFLDVEDGSPDVDIDDFELWQDDNPAAAVSEADFLRRRIFCPYEVAVLHGGMSAADKARTMEDFAAGRVQVLVSTTVIEVGIDVPAATVMIIEDADRFGLSQLHQLRGRVGRGSDASYVYLVSSSVRPEAMGRLDFLTKSDDGFELAEFDLSLRREGDLLGVRQSGASSLKLVRLATDGDLIEAAYADAAEILKRDPTLSAPSHKAIAREIKATIIDKPDSTASKVHARKRAGQIAKKPGSRAT